MYWRNIKDHPDKAGNYFTDVGPCYFQGGVWKNHRHYRPTQWLDQKNEPWVSVDTQLPDNSFPLFVFIDDPDNGVAVITGGVYDDVVGFSLITPHVIIKSPVTHWMYQCTPPASFIREVKAKAIKDVIDKAQDPGPVELVEETSTPAIQPEHSKFPTLPQL